MSFASDASNRYRVPQDVYSSYSRNSGESLVGGASYRDSYEDPLDSMDDLEGIEDEPLDSTLLDADESEDNLLNLDTLGEIDPVAVFEAIDEISDRYLTDIESDLIDLMKKGRRPVEISRILKIPECEVVRLRRNCFRKIRVVFFYSYHKNKDRFLNFTIDLLKLNDKQVRILTMFFDYNGLRPIAEVIGTRPSNVHRSLKSIKTKLEEVLSPDHEHYPFLKAFEEFRYLNLRMNDPQ